MIESVVMKPLQHQHNLHNKILKVRFGYISDVKPVIIENNCYGKRQQLHKVTHTARAGNDTHMENIQIHFVKLNVFFFFYQIQ